MRIVKNTTGKPTPYFRAMVNYCARELEIPRELSKRIKITFRSRNGSAATGRIWFPVFSRENYRIVISVARHGGVIGPHKYGGWAVPQMASSDRLLHVIAHELAHAKGYHSKRDRSEDYAQSRSFGVYKRYMSNRPALVGEWEKLLKAPAPAAALKAPPKPKQTTKEKNAAKARAMLAKWEAETAARERSLKAARKKVNEYGRKVRRYEKEGL